MANILLVLPDSRKKANNIAKTLREEYGHSVLRAKNEADTFAYLCFNTIDIVIIDPVLSPDFLFENTNYVVSEKTKMGEVGLLFLSNLKKEIVAIQPEPQVILFTIVDKKNLAEIGFDPTLAYVWRGTLSRWVLPQAIEEVLDPKHLKN